MGFNLSLIIDPGDVRAFTAFLESMDRKAARAQIVPILKEAIAPLVASEKQYLSSHTKSGALSASLSARSGGGDRAGTVSVFAAATAKPQTLARTWGGKRGSKQQQGWAASLGKRGRRAVFYADFVEKGHRIVRTRKDGRRYEAGQVPAYPFAGQAVASLGDAQCEAAAKAVLDHILPG